MAFKDRLKERREELGLSRTQLAEKLNVTVSAVGNYESGISHPKEEILYKIFEALDVEPNFLFQDEMPLSKKEKAPIPEESETEANVQGRKFTPREIEVYNILEETFVRLGLIEPGGDLTSAQADAMIALIKIIKLAFNPGNKKAD